MDREKGKKSSMILSEKSIVIVWLAFFSIIFLLLFFQSLGGHYGDRTEEAWAWFTPLVVPTLGMLIKTVFEGESNHQKAQGNLQKGIGLYLSFFYLVLILIVLILQPIFSAHPADMLKITSIPFFLIEHS